MSSDTPPPPEENKTSDESPLGQAAANEPVETATSEPSPPQSDDAASTAAELTAAELTAAASTAAESTVAASTVAASTDADTPGSGATADAAADAMKRKILVGSRRSKSSIPFHASKPKVARKDQPVSEELASAAALVAEAARKPDETSLPIEEVAPIPRDVPKVPTPSRRDPLSPEMEAELSEAMGDISLDAIVDGEAAEQASQVLELDARIRGKVLRIEGDNVFFEMVGRTQGVCTVRAFQEPPKVDSHMDVVPKKYNSDDGLYEVVVPGASIQVADWSDLEEGAIVEGRITGANTGGLECMVNTIRAFIPSSQVALFRVEDFAEYIGQKLLCVVTEVNPRKKNLVLSHRALLEREREEARKKLIAELAVGQIRDGVVSNVRDFGAFVDLGGIDGLIHVSQLSWDRVKHPSDVVQPGQKVRVKIEKINADTGKIGLSYRDLLDHPWDGIEHKLSVGSQVKGAVTRIAQFGAFVKLAPGVEGFIHISEMAHHRIRAVSDVIKEDEEVEVKILSIDAEAQKIGLSLKATLPVPEAAEAVDDGPPPEPAIAKRKGPLRGGFDRPTGGDEFGLRW